MEIMLETEKKFMKEFSNSKISNHELYQKVKLQKYDKFLNNDIGIKYIGNMLKEIDIRLYLNYLKMLDNDIRFIDDYKVENSVCVSELFSGITRDVKINVPNIRRGIDLLATSHELGHGIKSFTKLNNERYLHSSSLYNESISILFGKICLDRYVNDFGYDIQADQFEILNINNAINCLKETKSLLSEYLKKKEVLDSTTAKIVKNRKQDDYKFQSFVREVEKLKEALYILISYPIGISLANVYDNFTDNKKREYLNFVAKYLLNIKHIRYEMILEYFDIPFEPNFYINNFKEYIEKFESRNTKILRLGRIK